MQSFYTKARFILLLTLPLLSIVAGAQTLYTGTFTIGGGEGTITSCNGGVCNTSPMTGGITATFASPNLTYSEYAGFGGGSTPQSVATEMCNALTTYVKCTGMTVDSSGFYTLNLTSELTFIASAIIRIGTNGGRGNVYTTGPYFSASPPNFGVYLPKFFVTGMLYAAPGNASSSAFTNSTSETTTSSIGSIIATGVSTSYTASLGFGGDKVSVGTSSGDSSSTTDTESFNQTLQTTSGSSLSSTSNSIDHTQDQFWLLLNPQVVVQQTATGTVTYSVSTINNANPDVVNVSVAEMQTPSLIPLSVLETRTDPATGNSEPGLKNICAQPLPDPQCTQANACGCVPSDFSQILPLDELLGSPGTNPTTLDPQRFLYVTSITLEGPACASGCDDVKNTYMISDSNLTSSTSGASQTYSVGYTLGIDESFLGIVSAATNSSQTFSWTNNYSFGSGSGSGHAETVTTGTNSVGCYLSYDVYQDAEFHTFAFYPSNPNLPPCS